MSDEEVMRAVMPSEERAYTRAMARLEALCGEIARELDLDGPALITLLLSRASAVAKVEGICRHTLAEACRLAYTAIQPEAEEPS